MLAAAPADVQAAVLAGLDERTAARVRRELATARRRGFAVNDQESETGLTAVGASVPGGTEGSPAAMSLALPSATFSRERLSAWGAAVTAAAAAIAADLATGTT